MNERANNRPEKHFYGTSQPGSGKTSGILLSIFNILITKNLANNMDVQYLVICSTYDMAYATYQLAQKIQEKFCYQFIIGFLTKEADLNLMNEYHIIICTKTEIVEKVNGHRDVRITHIIMDDADAYYSAENIIHMLEQLPNTVTMFLSSCPLPNLKLILPMSETLSRFYNSVDSRHYVEILPFETCVLSMDFKLGVLIELCKTVANICPLGQMLVFCHVSMLKCI